MVYKVENEQSYSFLGWEEARKVQKRTLEADAKSTPRTTQSLVRNMRDAKSNADWGGQRRGAKSGGHDLTRHTTVVLILEQCKQKLF